MKTSNLHTEKEALRFAKVIRNATSKIFRDTGTIPLSAFFLTLRDPKDGRPLEEIAVQSFTPTDREVCEDLARFESQVKEIAETCLAVGVLQTFGSQVFAREVSVLAGFLGEPIRSVLAVTFEHLSFSPMRRAWVALISQEHRVGHWVERPPTILREGPRSNYITYYS